MLLKCLFKQIVDEVRKMRVGLYTVYCNCLLVCSNSKQGSSDAVSFFSILLYCIVLYCFIVVILY